LEALLGLQNVSNPINVHQRLLAKLTSTQFAAPTLANQVVKNQIASRVQLLAAVQVVSASQDTSETQKESASSSKSVQGILMVKKFHLSF
jgi:hypothetical protein